MKQPHTRIPQVVDLFCGAGGLSLGAHQAGFHSLIAVDVDPDLAGRYRSNFPRSQLLLADIGSVGPADWQALLGDNIVDGVVGGPPCQGFSDMGHRRAEDPRNHLVAAFMRSVAAINPSFFLMENVPGLMQDRNSELLDAALSELPSGYCLLSPMVLDAAEYGAATSRKRLVVIGYDPTRLHPLDDTDLLPDPHLSPGPTVQDAIADLPSPRSPTLDVLPYKSTSQLSHYAKTMRGHPPDALGTSSARRWLEAGLVSGLMATAHSEPVVARFKNTPPGAREKISRYPRLTWGAAAPVLRAGTGSDRGSFQAARPIHPTEDRVITVREAARLQGFPDWFEFAPTKWHSHRMIGNSVSPPFASALLKVIRERLKVPDAPPASRARSPNNF